MDAVNMICGNLEKFKTTFLVFNTGILFFFYTFIIMLKAKLKFAD